MIHTPHRRRSSNSTALTAVLLACLTTGLSSARAADPPLVTVSVESGRMFTGAVDTASNAERLWLRFDSVGMVVRRPVAWSVVRGVHADGRLIPLEQFRRELERWKSSIEDPIPADFAPGAEPRAESGISDDAGPPARVRSTQIEATLVNWDADVEADGLLVRVAAVDAFGNRVAAHGSVEVELIGEGPGTTAVRQTFPLLGRWVRPVEPASLGPNGYEFWLEFQALDPEYDLALGPVGLIHARLVVPGSGTFEATTGPTVLRPANAVRDRLQQQAQTRFFANEQTGRGKRVAAPPPTR